MSTLSEVHKILCSKITVIFPKYKGKRIVNRMVKHRLVTDIINLGTCVVNQLENKEIEKIFLGQNNREQSSEETITSNTEMSALLSTVYSLCGKMQNMERDISQLKKENSVLKNTVSKLSLRQSNESADLTISFSHPNNTVEDTTTTPEQNPVDNESQNDVHVDHNVVIAQDDGNTPEAVSTDSDGSESGYDFQRIYKKKLSKIEKRLSKLCASLETTNTHDTAKVESHNSTSVVYIGGIDPAYCDFDVKNYIQTLGVDGEKLQVERLGTSPDWSSYKVTVPSSFSDTILDSRNWSNSIKVRPFLENQNTGRGPRNSAYQHGQYL